MNNDNLIIIITSIIGTSVWASCLVIWCKLKKRYDNRYVISNEDYSYDKETEIKLGNYNQNCKSKQDIVNV